MNSNILLYADDPGGLNYLSPLKQKLTDSGFSVNLIVDEKLSEYGNARKMPVELRSGRSASELLSQKKMLIVGTSENQNCFAHVLTAHAKQMRTESIAVVDMEVNAENRFRGGTENPLKYATDWLVVPDEFTVKAYQALGFNAEKILLCGHPHYDVVRERKKAFEKLDRKVLKEKVLPEAPEGRPIWVFLADAIDQLNPDVSFRNHSYTLLGRGDTDFRSCIVLEELLDASKNLEPKPWVVLRLHPKNDLDQFSEVIEEVDYVSQLGDPLELIWSADRVFGMTTMLLLEAYLLGCNHVSILPDEKESNWLVTLKSGLTQVISTSEELFDIVSKTGEMESFSQDLLPAGAADCVIDLVNKCVKN